MSDLQLRPLSSLEPGQLQHIADLHCSELPSVLGLLGSRAVTRFYRHAVTLDSTLGCLATRDGRAVGIVIGHRDPDALYHRVRRPPWRFAWDLLGACLHHPWLPLQILASLWTGQGEEFSARPGDVELMYLVVDPASRRSGVGRALVQAFLDQARERKLDSVLLGVEVDNPGAIALYESMGFTITRSLRQGLFERHRMTVSLS